MTSPKGSPLVLLLCTIVSITLSACTADEKKPSGEANSEKHHSSDAAPSFCYSSIKDKDNQNKDCSTIILFNFVDQAQTTKITLKDYDPSVIRFYYKFPGQTTASLYSGPFSVVGYNACFLYAQKLVNEQWVTYTDVVFLDHDFANAPQKTNIGLPDPNAAGARVTIMMSN